MQMKVDSWLQELHKDGGFYIGIINGETVIRASRMWEYDPDLLATTWSKHYGLPVDIAYLSLEIKASADVGVQIDYKEYIRSQEWRAKATAAKDRADWRCQVCNKHKDQVTLDAHHRTYERLGDERPEDITVLCRDCHSLYEKAKKNGAKITPSQDWRAEVMTQKELRDRVPDEFKDLVKR